MKKVALRTISMLLLIAVFLPLCFIACDQGGTQTETPSSTESSTETESGNTGSDIFPYLTTDLERQDWGNTEVVQLYRGPGQRMSHEIYMENGDKSTDKIDYAVFQKNSYVEDYLKIKFVFEARPGEAHGYELINTLEASVKSGDDDFQIVSNSNAGTINTIMAGSFINLHNVKNLDLSKDYWAKFVNDNADFSGAIFGVTGSISLYLYQELYVCFVNKTLCKDWGIVPEELYKTVSDGDWTLDKMIELTKEVWADTNGNGADKEDIYGYGWVMAPSDAYWSACDIRLATKDPVTNGMVLSLDQSKLQSFLRKVNGFVWGQDGVLRLDNEADQDDLINKVYLGGGAVMVATDRVLFSNDRLYEVTIEEMKNCDHYGIIPYPKYNKNQTQYYSYVHDSYTIFLVPLPARNEADLCGAVLECLAYTNHNKVMPVYYEEVLTTRYSRDPQSVRMLNIIFQNVKMDPGVIFGSGGLYLKILRNMIAKNSSSVASAYRNGANVAKSTCERVTVFYKRYANNGLTQ